MRQPRRTAPTEYRRTNPGTRPREWWAEIADVPDGLRQAVPHPDPRWLLDGRAEPEGYRAAKTRWEEHRAARLRFLLAGGRHHLRPGERAIIEGILSEERR